jgi:hypothetical protein
MRENRTKPTGAKKARKYPGEEYYHKKRQVLVYLPFLLPNLDSNQDKQSQSLSYYRYTIRQFLSIGLQYYAINY